MWKKGQSGNPAGRQTGIRNKINDSFLRALAREWDLHGDKAISKVRQEDPSKFVSLVAALLPRQAEIGGKVEHEHTHDHTGNVRLSQTDALLTEVAGEREERPPEKSVPVRPVLSS